MLLALPSSIHPASAWAVSSCGWLGWFECQPLSTGAAHSSLGCHRRVLTHSTCSHRWFFHSQWHEQILHLLSQLDVIQRLEKSIPVQLTWRVFKVNWLVMSACVNHQGAAAPRAWHGGAAWSSHTAWHFSQCFPLSPDCKAAFGEGELLWSFDVCDTQCNLDYALDWRRHFQGAAVPTRLPGMPFGIRGNSC